MPVVSLRELSDDPDITLDHRLHIYNALDCMITLEVWQKLQTMRDPYVDATYNFSRSMQKPALTMMMRGVKVDLHERNNAIMELIDEQSRLQSMLDRMADAIWSKPLNPNSPKQLAEFFYDFMKIAPRKRYKKGEVNERPADSDALAYIAQHFHAQVYVAFIQAIKALGKQRSVLESGLSPAGRLHAGYSVCGTETGRWSSSQNCFGGGTNLQNITKDLRRVFIPDPGKILCYADLARAEAVVVAYISGDENYIKTTTLGDSHLAVARLCWPELPWTGDDALDKSGIGAEIVPGTHFSYRDLAKRAAHGTNYYAKPRTISTSLGIPIDVAESFQHKYFRAYPGLKRWHMETANALQTKGEIVTPYFNRRRKFLSRPSEDSTLREAIAYVPQSMVGDILNLGLYRVWEELDQDRGLCQILGQIHDAVLLQCDTDKTEIVTAELKRLMEMPIEINNRTMTIKVDPTFGTNWKEAS